MSDMQDFNGQTSDVLDPVKIISDYLVSQQVLTLCFSDQKSLRCASFFYLFEPETMSFLVMTDAKTRHGQMIEKNACVAGTVSDQQNDIVELKGVQFSGSISLLIGDKEEVARRNFYNSFPFAKMIPSPIWRVKLDEIKMIDNWAGFAHEHLWQAEVRK